VVFRPSEQEFGEFIELKIHEALSGRVRISSINLEELRAMEWAMTTGKLSTVWDHWAYLRQNEIRVSDFDYSQLQNWTACKRPLSAALERSLESASIHVLIISFDGSFGDQADGENNGFTQPEVTESDSDSNVALPLLISQLSSTLDREEGTVIGAVLSHSMAASQEGLSKVIQKMREPWKTTDSLSADVAEVLSELASLGLVDASFIGDQIVLSPPQPDATKHRSTNDVFP
jgi:hypothetical protein